MVSMATKSAGVAWSFFPAFTKILTVLAVWPLPEDRVRPVGWAPAGALSGVGVGWGLVFQSW